MAEKTKAPSKNHKWDAKNKRWVLKTFEERQKGRNILLQGKNNPIRVVHDTIRNVNAAKEVRKKDSLKTNNKSNNTKSKGSSKDQDDARKEAELSTYLKKKPKGGYSKSNTKDPGPGKTTSADSEKAAWLKKTRNSPAAKSGAFTDDERWAQQQKHRKWKSDRKAKTPLERRNEKLSKKGLKPPKSKNKTALKAGAEERGNPGVRGGDADYGTNKDGSVRKQPTASEQMKKYKPKKKKKNLTKNEIKYPTRGTFRGI